MSKVFDQYAAYYDLLYQDKDYAAEIGYVADVLRRSIPDAKDVLEFGAGTGRHGRLLAKRGFNVVGIEASERMVMLARQADEQSDPGEGAFLCEPGDIRNSRIDTKFDAVISLFHVVSYQISNSDLLGTFENAAHHLKPRGIFFFDVWHGPAVLGQRPAMRVKRAENDDVRLLRLAEPILDTTANVVTVTYTLVVEFKSDGKVHRFEERHRMRYLFPEEIEMLAAESGFAVEKSEEFLTGAAPSNQTWGVAYLLRKRG